MPHQGLPSAGEKWGRLTTITSCVRVSISCSAITRTKKCFPLASSCATSRLRTIWLRPGYQFIEAESGSVRLPSISRIRFSVSRKQSTLVVPSNDHHFLWARFAPICSKASSASRCAATCLSIPCLPNRSSRLLCALALKESYYLQAR